MEKSYKERQDIKLPYVGKKWGRESIVIEENEKNDENERQGKTMKRNKSRSYTPR